MCYISYRFYIILFCGDFACGKYISAKVSIFYKTTISPFLEDKIKNRFSNLYKNIELDEIKNKLENILNEIKILQSQ